MIKSKQLVKEYIESIGKYTYEQRDCIGSIWKILEKYGAKTDLVGSNWFARHELRNMRPLTDQSQLYDGCAVLKTLLPGEAGYNLPVRYKEYMDQIDYNHIGIGTDDGRILDSTRTVGGRDGPGWSTAPINSRSWDIIADFEDVDYSDRNMIPDEMAEGEDDLFAEITAIVSAKSGNTVNLRERPSVGQNVIVLEYVPVGTVVQVLSRSDGWSSIKTPSGKKGWMKSEFLISNDSIEDGNNGCDMGRHGAVEPDIILSLPQELALVLYDALKQAIRTT